MKKDINEGRILGEVTDGPFDHTTKTDKLVARFVVATSSEHGGEEYVQYHQVTSWMDDARWVLNNIEKGMRVYVQGEMRTRSYPGADGTKHYSFEIVSLPIKHGGIIAL